MSVAHLGGWATFAGTFLVGFWLRDTVPVALLTAWVLAMLIVTTARFVVLIRFKRKFVGEHPRRWEYAYAAVVTGSGLLWGLLAWMPVNVQVDQHLFLTSTLLFAVLMAGSTAMVASRAAFVGFVLAIELPLASRLVSLDSERATLMGWGLCLITIMMVGFFLTQRRFLLSSLQDQYRNELLLQEQQVIFESASEGIVLIKPKPYYVVSCNRRFAELLAYPMDNIVGMPPRNWYEHREEWESVVRESQPVIERGERFVGTFYLTTATGGRFLAEASGMAVAEGNPQAGTVWVVSDVTERRAAEKALKKSEQRFRDLVKLSSDLYWEQDANYRFTHFDGPTDFTSKLPIDRVLGRTRWQAQDILDVPETKWRDHIATLNARQAFRDFVYQINGRCAEKYWLSVSGKPMFDDNGVFVGYYGTASDITLRVEAEERYRHLANHDPLTGLPNRRLFADRVDQAIRSASRGGRGVAVLLLDLDGFKQVNDDYGHAAGDRVLTDVATRLRTVVRDADTLARLGGDEFVVLLAEIGGPEDALKVAEKIIKAVAEPFIDGEHTYQIGTSVGISLFPDHGQSVEVLLHRADNAMYHSKFSGGGTAHLFDQGILN